MPSAASAQFGQSPLSTATIGVVAPFTGDSMRLGEQLANGVRKAIDDTNQLRTSLDRAYTMRTFDDQDSLSSAIVNAQFAADDQSVVCVIGHLSGRTTNAALPQYANRGMPLIVPVTSYDAVTSHGYGNIVRLPTKDSVEGILCATNIFKTLKPTRVANIYLDGDYGFEVAEGFDRQMNLNKVDCRSLKFGFQAPDFTAMATQINGVKPEAVFLAGLSSQMGPLPKALRDAGYTGPLFASQGFFDSSTISKGGAAVEGLIVSSSMPPLTLAPGAFRIAGDFQTRYGAFTPISAFGYAAAQVAMTAIHRSGTADRQAVLRLLGLTPYDTVVGPFQFAGDGDPNDPNVYFYAVRDGKWSYAHAAHPSSFLIK
jgi:branched-chain amino acid transport system substrate-binding protein